MEELKFEDSSVNGREYRKISDYYPQEFWDVLVYQDLFEDGYSNPFVATHDREENEWKIHLVIDKGETSAFAGFTIPCEDSDVWTYIFTPEVEEN